MGVPKFTMARKLREATAENRESCQVICFRIFRGWLISPGAINLALGCRRNEFLFDFVPAYATFNPSGGVEIIGKKITIRTHKIRHLALTILEHGFL